MQTNQTSPENSAIYWHKPQKIILPEYKFDLRQMRKAKRLTLRKVEEITGISNSYLSQLETGKIDNPSYNVVLQIVNLYNS